MFTKKALPAILAAIPVLSVLAGCDIKTDSELAMERGGGTR